MSNILTAIDTADKFIKAGKLVDAGVKGAKIINPALKAYYWSQTPAGRYVIKAGKQVGKTGMAHLQAPSSNLPSHYTLGPGGSTGAYRANKGMKLVKKGGDMYEDGGRMYDNGGKEPDVNDLLQFLAAQSGPGGAKPFRREMQDLENQAFIEDELSREERYEGRWGEGGTREQRLRNKALKRAVKEHYGVSSDPTSPGRMSTEEIMNNPEMMEAIPDEVYQKHFGKLWDRSEFFRELFFASPEQQAGRMYYHGGKEPVYDRGGRLSSQEGGDNRIVGSLIRKLREKRRMNRGQV